MNKFDFAVRTFPSGIWTYPLRPTDRGYIFIGHDHKGVFYVEYIQLKRRPIDWNIPV